MQSRLVEELAKLTLLPLPLTEEVVVENEGWADEFVHCVSNYKNEQRSFGVFPKFHAVRLASVTWPGAKSKSRQSGRSLAP